jgi:hypothetical protein
VKKNQAAAFFLCLGIIAFPLQGQSPVPDAAASDIDTPEFPQWGKDLRRAEIIAFGTFPFTMFSATFAMDTWRASRNSWDGRYMPWPLKTAGAIEMTRREREIVMMSAAAASVVLALTDFVIIKIKRSRVRQRNLAVPEGTPIVIKRPLPEPGPEEPDAPEGGGETPGGSAAPGLIR